MGYEALRLIERDKMGNKTRKSKIKASRLKTCEGMFHTVYFVGRIYEECIAIG